MSNSHYVVIKSGRTSQFKLCRINIFIVRDSDSGGKSPDFYFPIAETVTSVRENSPPGTFVFQPPFVAAGSDHQVSFWTESSAFSVNPTTGAIMTRPDFVIDYEAAVDHHLQVFAKTKSGQSVCNVRVLVESVDEFPPVFAKVRYNFNLAHDAAPGDTLGSVQASDRDAGPDGRVFFSLSTPNPYFSIHPTKGTITVSRPPDTGILPDTKVRRSRRSVQDIRLVVEAKSRRIGSLSASIPVFVSVDEMALPSRADPNDGSGSVASWVTGVVVGIVLIVVAMVVASVFYCKVKRAKEDKERKLRLTGKCSFSSYSTYLFLIKLPTLKYLPSSLYFSRVFD